MVSPLQILVVFLEVIFASQKSRIDLARFMSGEYFIDDCSAMEEGFTMTLGDTVIEQNERNLLSNYVGIMEV